jgi:hypothetical protein
MTDGARGLLRGVQKPLLFLAIEGVLSALVSAAMPRDVGTVDNAALFGVAHAFA